MTHSRFLTKTELHKRLVQHGHSLCEPETKGELRVDVWPPPEIAVIVALEVDAFAPAYRQRYFVFVRDENRDPAVEHAPEFAYPAALAAVAARTPVTSLRMDAPVRWLLFRLKRFPRLLLWPEGGFRGPDGCGFLRRDKLPRLQRLMQDTLPTPAAVGAVSLDLSIPGDCELLWELVDLVAQWSYDFYFSDPDGREVYLLHHHEQVVISIPADRARQELLRELGGRPNLFEDCSGYILESDEGEGCADSRALVALGATAILVGGVSYGFDRAVLDIERTGMQLADQVTLGRRLQVLGAAGMLPGGYAFDIAQEDQPTIHVVLVQKGGQWYFTAWHWEQWPSRAVVGTSYNAAVNDIQLGEVPAFHIPQPILEGEPIWQESTGTPAVEALLQGRDPGPPSSPSQKSTPGG
ncbi:MAG TPA: hypothetical protein VEL76_33975 [Gemmataceae bacterium]|nr:hypothetical protein [Gemmataceae bacterium]